MSGRKTYFGLILLVWIGLILIICAVGTSTSSAGFRWVRQFLFRQLLVIKCFLFCWFVVALYFCLFIRLCCTRRRRSRRWSRSRRSRVRSRINSGPSHRRPTTWVRRRIVINHRFTIHSGRRSGNRHSDTAFGGALYYTIGQEKERVNIHCITLMPNTHLCPLDSPNPTLMLLAALARNSSEPFSGLPFGFLLSALFIIQFEAWDWSETELLNKARASTVIMVLNGGSDYYV